MKNRRLILILSIILIAIIAISLFIFFRKTPATQTPGLSGSLLPSSLPGSSGFGSGSTSIIGGATSTPGSNTVVVPRLRHLTLVPTAGDIVIQRQLSVIENRVKVAENAYFVRYMDRATGHIYETKTDETSATKLTNTTIPKVYEATFVPGGDTVVARFVSDEGDQILTYSVTLKDKPNPVASSSKPTVASEKALREAGLKDTVGTYLPTDIAEIALSPQGKLLALSKVDERGSFTLSDASGKGSRVILSHPLYEWQVGLPNESTAVISTKPSGIANGYAYTLNLGSGVLRKITGGIAGLTLLANSDLSRYLGGATPGGDVKLFVVTDSDSEPHLLPISTMPEKCVWSRTEATVAYCAVPMAVLPALYPDDWYKGRVSFVDTIWKIDTSTEETSLVSDLPVESGQAIDAIKLQLSADDKYLTFINKTDLTLWGLDLSVSSS